ncbi:Kinesin-like protein kif21a, variant 2 [Clonorchis sinensis]|uniref:Kinesin-like protein kif21a, variant 2 n=1 Tax=Clonorchis sinensis TaxID=79923 RepID=A0A8T1ML06_CLOSI|nr:Kinesin-like protein kif21a, variant 2 [Clonorchis sinensis]
MAVDDASTENDSTSVHVAVRVRPQSAREKLEMSQICTSVLPNAPQIVLGKDSSFTFDYVFNINSAQDTIFNTLARPLIDGCLNGYNATILAYGQTGSGKTYTMGTGFDLTASNQDAGIIPRAVQYLFARISQCRAEAADKHQPVPEFKVVAQFLELYNEELVDLLDADRSRKPHLRLHENAQGDIYLTGVSTRLVSSLNDTLKCLRDGSLVRSTASTNMNAQSSRSHAIFTLHVRQQRLVKYDEDSNGPRQTETQDSEHDPDSTVVDPIPEYETLTAKFHFVDLAGSERLKRTGATGDRAKEGISINRGLLALGNVISALGDKAKRGCHVPYRDSKLTRLLQDSLGGNSRTIMIACISPSDCDFLETLNTLKYANRARNIRNRIVMNQDKTSKQLSALRAQLAALQEELDGYRQGKLVANSTGADGTSDVSKELEFWRRENEKLRLRVKALTVTVSTLKVRNAQLLADLEASSWASSKEKLLRAAQGDSAEQNMEDGERSSLNLIVGEMDSVRELVERYTVENEELRTKLAEAEALAEFSQRPLTYTSPCQPGRLGFSSANNFGPLNRVALSNNEFPDLDTSTVAAAEAGLSAANTYLDDDVELESTMIASSIPESGRHKSHRHRHRRNKSKGKKTQQQQQEGPAIDDRKPLNDLTPNGEPHPPSDSKAIKTHETSAAKEDGKLRGNSEDITMNGECYTDLEEDELNERCGAGDETTINLCDQLTMENEDPDALEATLLGEQVDEDGLTHSIKATEEYADGTLSDASDVQSSSDSSSSNESDNDSDDSSHQTDPTENEAKLHQSIARVSSQIDSKQRLLAELQAKAAQLDHLRRHYERKLNDLETRIRETEKERDRVLANLEHIGEERLRRTQEEFQKKLSSLQDSLKQLQQAKSDHTRLEREQAKKNGELRQLRKEIEELRRYKVDLAKRLQEETRRTRQLEVTSARQVMELKRAKSQADHQIRSLEAAHSAKERALQQKQAELEALKRKTLAQQRQLSSMASSRMTRSYIGGTSSPQTTGSVRRPAAGNLMSTSMHADDQVPAQRRINLRLQPTTSVKAKWTHIVKQLELEVQRRQTSARLEHDLQTWIREREHLSRRLQRLQRRRARVEEALPDEPEQEDITRVTAFDEQIRNVTAQLDSVQEAIRECQTSIIELDKFGPKIANAAPASRPKFASARSAMIHTLFANCTLSESRFLLGQLYEDTITRALQVNRLQHSEAQLRATLSVWEQERQQELEVLRLAMQHAGLPLDTVDNVISVAGSSESNKNVNICPHHGPMTGNTCDCCSVTGVTSSAPISSDDSSGEEQRNENHWSSGMYPVPSIRPNDLMSQSMYATMEPSSFSRLSRRHFSETEEPGSDRPDTADASGRPIKARLRVLLPQDMLGLSSTQGPPGPDSSAADVMPPPSSSVFLRRARTALPPFVTTGAQLMYTPSVDSMSVLRSQTVPLSAGPSPAVRRRVPTQCAQPASSTRQNLPVVHSVPSSMSASFTLGSQTTSTNEGPDTNAKHEVKSGPALQGNTDIDVFNRLTSGMSNSPHPSRGSIQPLQRSVPAPPSPTYGTSANIVTVSNSPPASYRLAEPTTTSPAASVTVSASGVPLSTPNQPLAAFFANLSVQQPPSTAAPTTCSTSTAFSGNLPGQSLQTSASFRVPMECTHIARGHSSAILDVEIAGNLMVTGSKDRTAKIWDLETMEEVETLRDHPNNVCKVRVCPVTGLVFTVCSYFIKVWDRRDARKCVRTLLSSGLSQDGELEMKVTRRQNICPPGETNIMDVALGGSHPALSHYMFLATANSVKLWDLRRYFAVGKLHGFHQAPVMVLAAGQTPALSSADEPQLTVVTGSKDHYIKVFSVGPNASALLTPTFDLEPPHYDGIESLALDKNTLFSGSRDGVIKKWNLGRSGRQEVMLAQAHKDWIEGLAITTDGMNLVSGCRAGTLKLWNVEDCTCLGEVPNAHDGAINAIRTHGDRIFTAGSDKDVRFWCLLDRADN